MKPFRVLTIDGGGMRGVYSAAYISSLMSLFAKERKISDLDFGKGFDLIAGTSTGAIVACAALLGIPMAKVVTLYSEHGREIFPLRVTQGPSLLLQILFRPILVRRGERALKKALSDVLRDVTIGQAYAKRSIAILIPAVEMGSQHSWVFKSSHLNGYRDDQTTLVDACMASTAAPIFRSLAAVDSSMDQLGGHFVFADGGLWANNPVLVGMLDALLMAQPDQPIEIYSLGSCPRPEGAFISRGSEYKGLWWWKFGARAMEVSLSAQEFAFDNMARLFAKMLSDSGREVSVVRFPNGAIPPDMLEFLGIDDARKSAAERLIRQAQKDALITKSACDSGQTEQGKKIASLIRDLPEMTADCEVQNV